jgi:hypothetical protein
LCRKSQESGSVTAWLAPRVAVAGVKSGVRCDAWTQLQCLDSVTMTLAASRNLEPALQDSSLASRPE